MSMIAVLASLDITQKRVIAQGTVTLAGNYATNGVTLDLSGLGIPANGVPKKVDLWPTVAQGAAMVFDQYKYIPGTTQANGKVQVGVGGAEMAAAAFAATSPTNQTDFVLNFRAEFERL